MSSKLLLSSFVRVVNAVTITLLGLDGRDRVAHAVANRDAKGRVSVTVALN